jgi:ubiquinone/menaquinone biosynthesis C-methylase UbiE
LNPSSSAAEWDRRYGGADLVWSAVPNRFVAEVLADAPPGRALDLAAGEGRNAVWLAERGWEVTAVDFSSAGLEKARRLAAARGVAVDLVRADLADWEPPPSTFDAVVIAYLQVEAPLLRQALHGAAVALTPGGRLVVISHHRDNLTSGWGGPQDPALLHTVEQISDALPGLVVERGARVRRPVSTADGTRHALDALVVASRPAT